MKTREEMLELAQECRQAAKHLHDKLQEMDVSIREVEMEAGTRGHQSDDPVVQKSMKWVRIEWHAMWVDAYEHALRKAYLMLSENLPESLPACFPDELLDTKGVTC